MTMLKTAGIHHITAFVNNAQQNVDFHLKRTRIETGQKDD